jgi:glucose dehydrogenase
MFHHDLAHTGYSTSKAPKTNQTLWTYAIGGYVSSPAVVDGRVFVGTDNYNVYALNASNGAYIWNHGTSGGVGSCPAVAGGVVYVSESSWSGKVYALNASNGALVWSYGITGGYVSSSPAVADGKVYFGSYDHKVYALNASNGAYIWNYTTGGAVGDSSPAVADGKVYVGSGDGKVYCLNASNGALVWNYTTGGGICSPAVADGKVYFGSTDHKVYALNASNGALVWNYKTGSIVYFSPAIAGGTVYVGSFDGKIYAFASHDVAITSVIPSKTEVYSGQIVNITVVAKNEGTFNETFDIRAFYDSTLIGTQTVTDLPQDEEKTLTFSWNTTYVPGGDYTISANTTIVPGEIDTADNAFVDGTIRITSPVRIKEVIPCNQTGYPKNTFHKGAMAYFKVTINSSALIPQNALIIINLYDDISMPIGVASFQGLVLPGTSTIIFGLPIPMFALVGNATVYANCLTDWPSQGGFPYCPEMSATLEITGS